MVELPQYGLEKAPASRDSGTNSTHFTLKIWNPIIQWCFKTPESEIWSTSSPLHATL